MYFSRGTKFLKKIANSNKRGSEAPNWATISGSAYKYHRQTMLNNKVNYATAIGVRICVIGSLDTVAITGTLCLWHNITLFGGKFLS